MPNYSSSQDQEPKKERFQVILLRTHTEHSRNCCLGPLLLRTRVFNFFWKRERERALNLDAWLIQGGWGVFYFISIVFMAEGFGFFLVFSVVIASEIDLTCKDGERLSIAQMHIHKHTFVVRKSGGREGR